MIRKILVVGVVSLFVNSIASAQTGPWKLTFSDEFNGTSLDTSKWGTQYPWGCHNNDEQECYQAANVTASGGLLHLTAKQQTVTSGGATYNYTSGMIQSSGSFSQTYGYFEMRAKIPKGQGFWPAFWTMPANGNWPPEIDIIEIGRGGDFNTARMTLHWGSNGSDNYQENDWASTDFSQAFHVFAVDWEPGIVTWYIDGVQRAQMSTSNVPTIPMYVLANLAVGGSWPGNVNSSTPLPSNMDIDYIRVWSKSSSACYASIPSPTDPIPTTPCQSTSTDTQAPTVPTNLTATAASSSQINLSWTASTDNVGVTGYNILRNGTQVGTSATNSYSDTGLSASTTYTYMVAAFDAGNNVSTNSASASATTQAAPLAAPVISSFSASPSVITTGQTATLSWSVSGNPAPTLTVNGSTVSGSSMTASPSATTSYTLVATNSGGSATANVTVTVSSSVLPTGLTSYWSFDEGAGTTAADGSGNANTGTVQGTATWSAGKIGSAAMTFAGTSANYLSTAKSYVNPATFSLALWFKTATVQGGKLIGFEKNQTGSSSSFDRHIYMDNSGKLYFGVYNGAQRSINSTASYNNNAWHHVVGALSPTSGMTLYVDGVLVASNTTVTSAENNTEFWRVGGGSLDSGWPAVPSSLYFNGSLDDVRIYDHALAVGEVAGVYALGGGGTGGTVDTTAPSTPTGLSATAISASQVNLTWTASTDNVGVTGYKVFRNGTQIATPATNSYNDTGLAASTTYSYTVSAYDAAGNNSPQTSAVLATTQAIAVTDTQAPTVPTNLTATASSSSQINLTWTASTDNVGVTGYKCFRNGIQIATITSGTSYQDSGLTASTTYSYTMSAFDAAGNTSALTAAVSATTQAATQPPPSGSNAPTIFFTDLDSGPNTGGENGNGAYVTIYGNNFGTSPTVTVGGGAALIKLAPVSYLWYQKLVVQLGAAAKTGNIIVTNANGSSNGLPFTVRSGNIYFVSTSGSDTNAGSFTSPWKTVPKAKNGMAAGDTTYVMNGVSQTAIDDYNACLSVSSAGASGSPKALVVYPGATATIGSSSCQYAMRTPSISGGPFANWVIAGFTLVGGGNQVLDLTATNYWKVVGNDMTCPNNPGGQSACWETSATANYIYAYGNHLHNFPSNDKQYHGFYFSDNVNHVWVGWNNIHDGGCRGIQFHSTGAPNLYDLHVHDNVIYNIRCDGVNMATIDPSKGAIDVYNNIIYHTGTGPDYSTQGASAYTCIASPGITNAGAIGTGTMEVFNNTVYDCSSRSTSGGATTQGAFSAEPNSPNIRYRNNIIYQNSNDLAYFSPDSNMSLVSGSNNLCFGLGGCPSQINSGSLSSDPKFVSLTTPDFHLQSTSPAIGAGTVISSLLGDIGGVLRGTKYDIGAYQYASGGSSVTSTCDLNGDGVVNQSDVNTAITFALSPSTPCGSADLDGSGQCNIVDVQRVINAANGLTCRVGP